MTPDEMLREWRKRMADHDAQVVLMHRGLQTQSHITDSDLATLQFFIGLILESMRATMQAPTKENDHGKPDTHDDQR